jgi:hypothetical protein
MNLIKRKQWEIISQTFSIECPILIYLIDYKMKNN